VVTVIQQVSGIVVTRTSDPVIGAREVKALVSTTEIYPAITIAIIAVRLEPVGASILLCRRQPVQRIVRKL
jgi:hypothetical protein